MYEMGNAYIFTHGTQYSDGFRWYIDYYNSIEEAQQNCEPGWSVMRYCDSDWYAICWDREKQKLVEVEYDTTRAGGGGRAEIDATPEVLREVYRRYKRLGREHFDLRTNPSNAKKVQKGDTVRVIRGRKVPKGTEGVVFWVGTRYNQYSRMDEERVGIEVAGERVFLNAEYVEVIGWEARLVTGRERKQAIRNFAVNSMPRHFRFLFSQRDWEWARFVGKEPGWKALAA